MQKNDHEVSWATITLPRPCHLMAWSNGISIIYIVNLFPNKQVLMEQVNRLCWGRTVWTWENVDTSKKENRIYIHTIKGLHNTFREIKDIICKGESPILGEGNTVLMRGRVPRADNRITLFLKMMNFWSMSPKTWLNTTSVCRLNQMLLCGLLQTVVIVFMHTKMKVTPWCYSQWGRVNKSSHYMQNAELQFKLYRGEGEIIKKHWSTRWW